MSALLVFCCLLGVLVWGGCFYFNSLKRASNEKLKQETIDTVRLSAPTLITGLARNQNLITMEEWEVITRFNKDSRFQRLLYLNKYGEVRSYNDPARMTPHHSSEDIEVGIPTDAIEQAWLTKTPIVRAVPNKPLYDIAVPLAQRGEVLGILNIQIHRERIVRWNGLAETNADTEALGSK